MFLKRKPKLTKSISRFRKRLGSAAVLERYFHDEQQLLDQKVYIGYFRQHIGRKTSLLEHIGNLEKEFQGRQLLELYHAILIVLIRREYNIPTVFAEFDKLWQHYAAELAQLLNLRWLTSAADTFIDHHPDTAVKALMLNVTVLINTVKIYESERLASDQTGENTLPEKLPLFDGLETFKVNHDDSLYNLRCRIGELCHGIPQGIILESVFERLNETNSAFFRLKQRHRQDRTRWWNT